MPRSHPVADLSARYRQRWQVETALAQLKTTRPMAVLPCQTGPGVLKELTVFAIVDHLVRLGMCQAALSTPSAWSGAAFWRGCGGSARQLPGSRSGP